MSIHSQTNGHTTDRDSNVAYKPSTTQQKQHSKKLTDTIVLNKLQSLNERITAECNKYPKTDTQLKQELFVELELLRLDYIERNDIYQLYIEYNKKLANRQHDSTSYDTLVDTNKMFMRIIHEFDTNRKLLYLQPSHYTSNKFIELVRLVMILTYSVGALIPLACLLPLKFIVPKTNKLAFDDHLSKLFAHGFLYLSGVTVEYEGLEHMYVGSNIGMFNHTSNLDPVVIQSSPAPFKYIAKSTMKYIPLIGQVMYMLGHIFIDRKNLNQAKKSLDRARIKLLKYNDSICISPEGTRSKTGRLSDFKKGPFHTAINVNLPIQPMILYNCFQLWSCDSLMCKPGHTRIRFLPVVQPIPNEDYNQLANRVRRIMLQGTIQSSNDFKKSTRSFWHAVPLWTIWWIVMYYLVRFIRMKFAI